MRSEVLVAVILMPAVFRFVVPCSLVEVYQYFTRADAVVPLKRQHTFGRQHAVVLKATVIFICHNVLFCSVKILNSVLWTYYKHVARTRKYICVLGTV